MSFAVVIISVALLVICKAIYSSYCNPISFYVIPWGLATALALSGLYGIYTPSDTTVVIILIAMIAFSIGCILIRVMQKPTLYFKSVHSHTHAIKRDRRDSAFNFQLSPRASRMLYCLGLLAIAYELFLASRSIPLLINGQSLSDVKYQYSNAAGATLYSTHELLLFSWIAEPILIGIMVFFACELCSHRMNWMAFILSVAGCALYIAVSGGRNLLFIFACVLFVALVLSAQMNGILRWIKALPRAVKMAIVIMIVAMIVITEQRSLGRGTGVLENVFFYLVGGIVYFDQMLADPSAFNLFGGQYLLGWSTFGFIINPILIIASIIFKFDYVGSDTLLSDAASVYLPFNDSLRGNALCTDLYAFLRDFGIFGTVIGPILFGMIVGFVWEKTFANGRTNPKWFPICVYLMYCVLFSDWRYILVFPGTTMVFAVIIAVNLINKKTASAKDRSTRRNSETARCSF